MPEGLPSRLRCPEGDSSVEGCGLREIFMYLCIENQVGIERFLFALSGFSLGSLWFMFGMFSILMNSIPVLYQSL